MKKNLLFTLFLMVSVLAFGQKLPFQGKLIESGVPVAGSHSFVFEIASVGWSEAHSDVSVTDGLYFVVLGSINPLPDSLFFGVSEQSMAISVDGTVLSPVTLFKPLSSPFEGGELVVHNNEGTKVGEMKNSSNWAGQNGEVVVYGPNGSKNVSLSTITDYNKPLENNNNDGAFLLHNSQGEAKVTIFSTPYRGEFGSGELNLTGETSGSINQGFNESDGTWDIPYFYMFSRTPEGNSFRSVDLSATNEFGYLDIWGADGLNAGINSRELYLRNSDFTPFVMIRTDDDGQGNNWGRLEVNSYDGKMASIEPSYLSLNRTGDTWREFASIKVENRDDSGDAGYLRLEGPNSTNISMGNLHWEGKADIPYMTFNGESDYLGIELGIDKDGEDPQRGFMTLNSEDGSSIRANPNEMFMHGPNSPNIQMGGQSWDNKDLGFFNVFTDKPDGNGWYYGAANISASTDGTDSWGSMSLQNNGEERISLDGHTGTINLVSENGKNLFLSPEGIGVQGVEMYTSEFESQKFGSLRIAGPNTTNVEFNPGWWDQPDRGIMNINGSTDENRIHMAVYENEQQIEFGSLNVNNSDQKEALIEPNLIRLNRTGDNWREFAVIHVDNKDNTGEAGYFSLSGPTNDNINFGGRYFEGNADLPFMHLIGENNYLGIDMGMSQNNEGQQFGFINLMSENGKSLHLSPESFGVDKISLNTVAENGGSSGEIYLWGENGSPNIQMGGQPWQNHDLGFFTVFTDKPDGNGWYYGAANIAANTDGTDSWGSMSLNNNDMQRITLDGQSGSIHGIAQDGKRAIVAPDEIIVTRADWSAVASLRNAGDYGELVLNGPNSNNVRMGGQGILDRPYFDMRGENEFHAVGINVIDDGVNQLGSLNLMSEDGARASYDPTGLWMDKARIDNYDSGQLQLSGPNSTNIEMGSTPGGSSDLGYFNLITDKSKTGALIAAATDGITSWASMDLFNDDVATVSFDGNGGNIMIAGSLNQNSDIRLKKDITQLANALSNIDKIRGVTYHWKDKNADQKIQIGVIAQEVEKVYPELVKTKGDGFKTVNYVQMVAVLIEGVKELNTKVEKLETENTQLKAEISASAANKTEIEQVKAQMESLVKLVQGQQSTALEATNSTPGLK